MSFLDNLETAVLFRFARLLTLLLVLGGVLMTVVGIILYDPLSLGQSSHVTACEVRSELTANPQAQAPVPPRYDSGGIAVSAELDRFILLFDPNEYDRTQLRAEASKWVQQLQYPDDRVQFLRNMSEVVGEFPQKERGGQLMLSSAYGTKRRYRELWPPRRVLPAEKKVNCFFSMALALWGCFRWCWCYFESRETRAVNEKSIPANSTIALARIAVRSLRVCPGLDSERKSVTCSSPSFGKANPLVLRT